MSKTLNVTQEQLAKIVNAAVAGAIKGQAVKPSKKAEVPANVLVDGKTERQLKTDVAVVRAFKKAGYGSVTPRVDVMTYNRWVAEGYKVKTGEKSVKVKQFRLFHKKQVEFVGYSPKPE